MKSDTHAYPGRSVSRRTHLLTLLCILCCVAFLAWAYTGQLDVVSSAGGEVVPQGKVKEIQHLEGGIVRDILVREGETVQAGQALIELETTASDASVEELELRLQSLKVDAVRLEAEATGASRLAFPEDLKNSCPRLVAQARSLFQTKLNRLQSEIEAQEDVIRQRQQDIQELTVRIDNLRDRLSLLREQIDLSEELLKENLTTRYKHLAFLKEETEITSAIEESAAALSRASSALDQARTTLKRNRQAFQEEAREQLKIVRQEADELTQRMRRVADNLQRTVIRSPVDGVVKSLAVFTRGGVVQPGVTVAEVVPASDRLVVEAHLPIGDIGFVHQGQDAVLKLPTADARRFGQLEGTVAHVSPDSFVTPRGQAFYAVRIETDKDAFEQGGLVYKLYPGMQVMAYIHTGTRTVLEYLVSPFLTSWDSALQER